MLTIPHFIFMSVFIVICVGIMSAFVRENKLSAINDSIEAEHPEWDLKC